MDGLFPVEVLRTFLLTFNNNSAWQVAKANPLITLLCLFIPVALWAVWELPKWQTCKIADPLERFDHWTKSSELAMRGLISRVTCSAWISSQSEGNAPFRCRLTLPLR